jgi:hypothetical protein
MINRESHPVGWYLMLTELEDVREHLAFLVKELNAAGGIEEEDFAVQLGHVYAHLNRIWHARNEGEGLKEEQWSEFSQFPKDLTPVG